MLIKLQIEEDSFSRGFIHSLQLLHFLVVAHCANSNNLVKRFIEDMLIRAVSEGILVGASLFFGLTVVVLVALLVAHLNGWNTRGTVRIAAVVNYFCSYMAYPLLVLVLSRNVAEFFFSSPTQTTSTSSLVLSIVGLVLCSTFVGLLQATKCSIPSKSATSQVSSMWTMIFHLLLAFTQLTSELRDKSEERFLVYLVFVCFGKLFLLAALQIPVYQRVYWDQKTNELVTNAMVRILCINVIGEAMQSRLNGHSIIWFLLIQALLSKLIISYCRQWNKINIFEPDISHHRFYLGTILMNIHLSSSDPRSLESDELDIALYYHGLWESACKQGKVKRNSHIQDNDVWVNETAQSKNNRLILCRLVDFVASKQQKGVEFYKLMNLLQVTQLVSYFRSSRQIFSAYASELGSGFFDEFEAFQMQALWETKLLVIDKGKFEGLLILEGSILDTFDYVKTVLEGAAESEDKNYLDIARAFRLITVFADLTDSIELIVQQQLSIFEALYEDSNFTTSVCRQLNTATLETRQLVCDKIKALSKLDDIANLYSYFYPSLISYYALVKYDVEKSDAFVLLYQKKLLSLMNSSSFKKEKMNLAGMEIDSVAVQVALERDSLGLISELTLNANQFLGEKVNENLEGKSINIFLPLVLADIHLKAIDSNRTVRVMNKQRSVFMCDLDSNLKQVQLNIKLAPSVTNPVCAYSLMTFESHVRGPSLLLDHELNVICADASFNKQVMFRRMTTTEGQTSNDKVHLSTLSKRLCTSVKILKKMIENFKRHFEMKRDEDLNNPANLQIKDRLYSMLNILIEQNTSVGLIFGIESGCPIAEMFSTDMIHAKFEFCEVLGKQLIKCYISRKSKTKLGAGQDKDQLEKATNNINSDLQLAEWMSDDQATNKAVREHNQVLVEYNSEQKESLVSKGMRLQGTASGDSVIHKFDDLLIPAAEIIKIASDKLMVPILAEDMGKSESNIADKSSSFERMQSLEMKPIIKEIVSLIVDHQQLISAMAETEKSAVRSMQTKLTDTATNHALPDLQVPVGKPDRHQASSFAHKNRSMPVASAILYGSPLGATDTRKENKDIIKVVKIQNPKQPKDMKAAKSLLDSDKGKSRRSEDKTDILSWVKSMHAKGTFKLKSQASNAFDVAKQQSGYHVPNVATYQSISKILFFFAVASTHAEKRGRRHQEIWCSVQQGFEDHQPERYSSLVLLFGCGCLHCFPAARRRVLQPLENLEDALLGLWHAVAHGPALPRSDTGLL